MLPLKRKTAAELLGSPQAPRNARDRLINTAIDLFYEYGFNAVGVDLIIARTGVTKTTFYKHFESKDQLMVEAVRRRDAWEREAWQKAVRKMAGPKPRNQLLGLFDVLDMWFNAPDFRGCMFINTAAEFPNPNDPIHEAAAEHKRAARDDARDLASAAELPDPEAFADQYTMILEGTLIMRQVHGRNDAARLARKMVEQLLAPIQAAGPRKRR